MKDTNTKTNRLGIAVLLFVCVIIVGFITISRPDHTFGLSLEQTLEQVLSFEDEISPDDAMEIVFGETAGYQFVDIRNPFEFVKGSVEGAKNIPYQNFLNEENLDFFDQMMKDSITVVVFGWNQTEANGPWMMLKQLGYTNVKIMMGGFGYYSGETFDMFYESDIPQFFVEEAKYNYVEIMENLGQGVVAETTDDFEMVIPKRKKKEAVVEGGC
ncbi:MAG: hypothetical protein CL663_06205 [Bacteroidetes bacterium]|nr:hypothetical protein [Bacteroidota bacterium]